jgi:hypothetical protein
MKKILLLFGSMLGLGMLLAQGSGPFTSSVTQRFNGIRMNLEEAAEVMPADKYSFKLTEPQMTFGEWIGHAAQSNYGACATLLGQERPAAAQQIGSLKEKDALSKALKDSFAYCGDALKGMDDQKALASPQVANAMLQTIVHTNEIYGNIVGYLRYNNIVPPSTARRGAGKGGKKKN